MAKKSKNKQGEDSQINQALMDHLKIDPNADSSEQEDNPPIQEEEDEFDALLRSFMTDTEPEKPITIPDPESVKVPVAVQREQLAEVSKEVSDLNLGPDEAELVQAYTNFTDAVIDIAQTHNLEQPEFFFEAKNLIPNYKPSIGRKIVADAILCWDVLFAAYPDRLETLTPSAKDEDFLNFAEGLSDQSLQLAIISYVEILIDIENCELVYEEKRLNAQRRRVERMFYEEYQERQRIRAAFVDAITKRDFPIDAERLVTNYLRNVNRDADGAYQALVQNPAVYAPIDIGKIKPRMFGLIKPTPKDGIRENVRIGQFLKTLTVS